MDLTEAKDGGVLKEVTKEGTGELPAAGMKCELEYTGKLDSGKVFDTTKDSVTGSFEFKLGKGEVIKGCTPCFACPGVPRALCPS